MTSREPVSWITVKGVHVPIFEGDSQEDAVNRAIAKYNEDKKQSDIAKNKKQADLLNKTTVKDFSQEQLKSLFDKEIHSWQVDKSNYKEYIEQTYENAKKFGLETANKDNFFQNSIGYWEKKSAPPKRPADYKSTYFEKGTGNLKKSSEYWYTDEGVYRRSNHWGMDVASCSWLLKGVEYKPDGVSKGYTVTAFIPWNELYPKGMFTRHYATKQYGYHGFTFNKG